MSRKRRRRERRNAAVPAEHAAATGSGHAAERHLGRKALERQRVEFVERIARLRRARTVIGALGFVPLILSLGCGFGAQALCAVPREIYLAVWAGLFGSFLGLTIRMWIERRRFTRQTSHPVIRPGADAT